MKRFILLSFALISPLFFICCKTNTLKLIVPDNQLKSYSVEDLNSIFILYREKYENVASIVLTNELLNQMMINSREGQVSIWTESKKACFTEKEWNEIVDLFSITGLWRIEKNSKSGNDVVIFVYRTSDYNSMLMYCETEDEQRLLYHKLRCSVFQQIDVFWWIGFSSDEDIGKHATGK